MREGGWAGRRVGGGRWNEDIEGRTHDHGCSHKTFHLESLERSTPDFHRTRIWREGALLSLVCFGHLFAFTMHPFRGGGGAGMGRRHGGRLPEGANGEELGGRIDTEYQQAPHGVLVRYGTGGQGVPMYVEGCGGE